MSTEPLSIDAPRFRRNRLLDRLDAAQFGAITSVASVEPLNVGQVLHPPEQPLEHVYFPLSGTASVVALSSAGTMVEAATIGREGTTGVPAFLGGNPGPLQVIAQVAGEAAMITIEAFRSQLIPDSSFDDTIRRYTQAQLVQTSQTALCNRLHELEERAARWILQTHDRVDGDTFGLTHEFLSVMLGVHRPTVTIAVGTLQQAGLIAHARGQISVVDRAGLEDAACECYSVVVAEYERVLGAPPS